MSRFRKTFVISKKLELNNRNINNEMIKHDHENEFTKMFLQKIWNRISRSHFTFRDKTQQNKLLAFSQQIAFLENNQHFQLYQLLFTKKKEIVKKKNNL
jgi:hypothetical protein